jgi:beta-glucosidase
MAGVGDKSLLGDGFLVGVATSGYQIEGGFNGPDEPHNNWSGWEDMGRTERSGIACDFWRHPEEALDRAAALGCNAFRLSVEWARLEPRPEAFDDAALERYVEILSMCAARGLAPMVTLHHFTHPDWQGEEFWLRTGSPDVFARHVRRILPALAPHCRHWVTID